MLLNCGPCWTETVTSFSVNASEHFYIFQELEYLFLWLLFTIMVAILNKSGFEADTSRLQY